jgi:hypothetical protein
MSLKNPARVMLALGATSAGDPTWSKVSGVLNKEPQVECVTILAPLPLAARPDSGHPEGPRIVLLALERLTSTRKSAGSASSYSAFRDDANYERFRFVALKLLNRKDLTGTLRFLEREVLVASTVGASEARSRFSRRQPNAVVVYSRLADDKPPDGSALDHSQWRKCRNSGRQVWPFARGTR